MEIICLGFFFSFSLARLDLMDFSSMKLKEKLNNYTIYSRSSSVSGFSYGSHACARQNVLTIFIRACDVKLDQLNWVIKRNPFTIEMFEKVLLCRLAGCIIESDDLVRVSIVSCAHSYQLNRANVCFFCLSFFVKNFAVSLTLKCQRKYRKVATTKEWSSCKHSVQPRVSMTNLCMWRARFCLSFSLLA